MKSKTKGRCYTFCLALTMLSTLYMQAEEPKTESREQFANKIVGFEDCTQCHKHSVEVWKRSSHFKSLESLNLDKDGHAKHIMKALKLKGSPASQASCAKCHFTDKSTKETNQFTGKKFGPKYGISCESCHGAAKEWVELHNKKSIKEIQAKYKTLKSSEAKSKFINSVHLKSIDDKIPADFKKWRDNTSESAGMIRPQMTYKLISNCYQCHTINDRNLINKTAELDEPHAAGSEFEIVSWLSGEVKHSFKGTDPDNPKNKSLTAESKRYLYVAGKILFAEHALKALSAATFPKTEDDEPSRFYEEMKARAEIGLGEITEINETLGGAVPEIKTITDLITGFSEKISEDQLTSKDINGKTFKGKNIIQFLADMNKAFLKNSNSHKALQKLDEAYINDLEAVGQTYK